MQFLSQMSPFRLLHFYQSLREASQPVPRSSDFLKQPLLCFLIKLGALECFSAFLANLSFD